ncbi:hypothetical protein TCAL_10220 [Tigriopus californicus]|uniref:Nucleolar protein 16 n=1 Tax=Tigriopus californicus TaxID=6832 RepID=A0A553PH97_TIGCA|nr:nucleolar protein 16-like [Tigriopus californicus]TRY77060.1 hypothetical protein TCAL_10220 [Tigriopus californicus]|eukprot:TCALIF_10220-PA protein Name:"Similar to Nop16 Nucleolar protein 16 (Rattus norvegicus)" AED:0.04 eAED:0.04 QI:167/1/1/1/1/1/4/194/211
MPGLRKLKKKQKFKYDRNRKRVQKTQELTKNSNVRLADGVIKAHWDARKPLKQNLSAMGLAYDANQVMSWPSTKRQMVERAQGRLTHFNPAIHESHPPAETEAEAELEASTPSDQDDTPVVRALKAQVAQVPVRQSFRFTSEEVRWITQMMDKHGDDFKAMARDPKNIWQCTPKQIRQKVVKFIHIPEQFAPFAKARGLLEDSQAILTETE